MAIRMVALDDGPPTRRYDGRVCSRLIPDGCAASASIEGSTVVRDRCRGLFGGSVCQTEKSLQRAIAPNGTLGSRCSGWCPVQIHGSGVQEDHHAQILEQYTEWCFERISRL